MPRRTDISTILIIGAGPIIIGQACEFDYSGAQACKAIRKEGYRVVLVNSNPATIMTDPDIADATYIEPLNVMALEAIIAKERPDALLSTMGGQTALNLSIALFEAGVLARYGVELIGADPDVIARAEDRAQFAAIAREQGCDTPASRVVSDMESAKQAVDALGLPLVLRPSFTMGGTGGGIARNRREYLDMIELGLEASPVSTVLVEESVLGWKEFELEVVRDRNDNCIIVCGIENIDPMGVHTGDSITVAPCLTLTDKEYQIMRDQAMRILRAVGVETGGANVQFALNPEDGRIVVIEMNPRVSRSSALASKATGFPIAKVAALLAVGYTLDELKNEITGTTPASFEPVLDYVVVKVPRFDFEKFPDSSQRLTTSMKSVGESMAVGGNFKEAMQKALCGLENGTRGFDRHAPHESTTNADGSFIEGNSDANIESLKASLAHPDPQRLLRVGTALREGVSVDAVAKASQIDRWFLTQLAEIVATETMIRQTGLPQDAATWHQIKTAGFGDAQVAALLDLPIATVRAARLDAGVTPCYPRIDSTAAEFPANVHYHYGTWPRPGSALGTAIDASSLDLEGDASAPATGNPKEKIIILGGGPNRIGQGIEFDYCCTHACFALREAGFETIMINCNPETVSTDYDSSDRLYFEPLTEEHVLSVVAFEGQTAPVRGVVVQFGGQTPLKLAKCLEENGITILGTPQDSIDLAEDRARFLDLTASLGLQLPAGTTAMTVDEAVRAAEEVGYPVLVRPSYVLGGRAMHIVFDETSLRKIIHQAMAYSGDNPVLIDHYLRDAIELDVDVLCDGELCYIAGIMEHIEEAGVHSGDSACALPSWSLTPQEKNTLAELSAKLAFGLGVRGVLNIQFALRDGVFYILEANPRASRTVPFVAKATGVPLAKLAALIGVGAKLRTMPLPVTAKAPLYALAPALAGQFSATAVVPVVLDNAESTHVSALSDAAALSAFPLPDSLRLMKVPQHIEKIGRFAVKESVFPFSRFPGTDVLLGPEMRSTGEVMGWGITVDEAFIKAQAAAGMMLPTIPSTSPESQNDDATTNATTTATGHGARAAGGVGYVLISVRDSHKEAFVAIARQLAAYGFPLAGTEGTATYLNDHGLDVVSVAKVGQGDRDIADMILDGEVVLVLNTTRSDSKSRADSNAMRMAALRNSVPFFTTRRGAEAVSRAITCSGADTSAVPSGASALGGWSPMVSLQEVFA
ncbi:MAG: carbamoyl-phosphate synthase large subunit [Alphaproteobacteria bacterium]|nr:carbamoyl-phosphate synthase large subunit [Alphaproteobacteria bacterium]